MSGSAREQVGCLEGFFGDFTIWVGPFVFVAKATDAVVYDGSRSTHSQTFSRRHIPSARNPRKGLSGTFAAEEHKHVTYLAHTCVRNLINPSQAWPKGLHMNRYTCVCICFGPCLSEVLFQQPSKEMDQTIEKRRISPHNSNQKIKLQWRTRSSPRITTSC